MVSREERGDLLAVVGRAIVAGDGSVEKAAALAGVRADVVRLDVGVTVAADDQGGQTVGVVNLGRGVVVGVREGVAGVAAKHLYSP